MRWQGKLLFPELERHRNLEKKKELNSIIYSFILKKNSKIKK